MSCALYFDSVLSMRFTCSGEVHIVFHITGIFKCQDASSNHWIGMSQGSDSFLKCYINLAVLLHVGCFLVAATIVNITDVDGNLATLRCIYRILHM